MALDNINNLGNICMTSCQNNECKFGKKLETIDTIFELDYKKLMFVCIKNLDTYSKECSNKISEKNIFIRMSRYTTSIFKNISLYTELYTEIIKEMISNHTSYPNVIFYILDIKFLLWKLWLESLLYWHRQLGMKCKECKNYKEVIRKLSDITFKDNYNMILNLVLEDELDCDIKNIFIKTHETVYEYFIEDLLNKLDTPVENGDFHEAMRIITDHITYWLTITVFELMNIESILVNEKAIISGVIVSAKLEGYDIIKLIKDEIEKQKGSVKIKDLLITTPDIFKYKYLFEELITKKELV